MSKIEFIPARKSGDKQNIRFRVEAVRYMLSSKILGITKSVTPYTYNDLYNCYTEEVKTMHGIKESVSARISASGRISTSCRV